MNERIFFLAYKLPSLAIGASIIFLSLFIVLFAQGCITTANFQASHPSNNQAVEYYSSSTNALAASVDEAGHAIGHELSGVTSIAKGGIKHVTSVTAQSARTTAEGGKIVAIAVGNGVKTVAIGMANGIKAVAFGIGKSVAFAMNAVANTIIFVFHIPLNVYGFIADNKVASSIITPSEYEHSSEVPIIDPNDPALAAAKKALPAIDPAQQPVVANESPVIAWPLHGAITTYFGEKGPHYHPTHTGLDISDGKHSPIKAYRAGTVIAAGRDGGLGNRVIVDHGNGVTSVYGHMSVIYAQVGQKVDTTTTLGLEGTTGVSTGNHLHFEIRINGQAADPLQFISGRP